MDSIITTRIKKTFLSEKPRELSILIAILSTLILLFFSALCWKDQSLYLWSAAIPENVLEGGEYWRLWTAIFVHADMRHFLSNAILFGFFSYLLYGYFGFGVFPLLAFLFGGVTNLVSILTYPDHIRLVGASGLVYLMAGFWLTSYLLIERRLGLKRRLLHALGVGLIVLMPTSLQSNVSYRTHAIGLVFGILLALIVFIRMKDSIRSAEVLEYELETTVHSEWGPN